MNNPSVIPAFDFREMVQAKNGEVVTTSRKVAKYFGKRHGDVLRKIEQVKSDCSSEFGQRNFASADYIGSPDVQPDKRWLDHGCDGIHWESCCSNQRELYLSIQLDVRTT